MTNSSCNSDVILDTLARYAWKEATTTIWGYLNLKIVCLTCILRKQVIMGGLISKKVFSLFYKNKEVRILMTGLDAAGKTTVLYTLKLGEVVTTIPTIGFNVETVQYKGVNFTTWDVGGRDKIRPLWRHYYQNTDILIFVVDSNDHERIGEAADELQRFLSEEELKDCILLVLANKQDLPNAMSVEQVTEKMRLSSLRNRAWWIQGTSAINSDGLYEGLEWLQSQVSHKSVKKVVTAPVKESVVPLGEKLSTAFSSIKNYFWSTA